MQDIEFIPSTATVFYLPGEEVIVEKPVEVEVIVTKALYWLFFLGFMVGVLALWLFQLLLPL